MADDDAQQQQQKQQQLEEQAVTSTAASTAPLSTALPHLIVAQHLRAHGFHATLAAFEVDARRAGIILPRLEAKEASSPSGSSSASTDDGLPGLIPVELELPNLLVAFTEHRRILATEAAQRAARDAQRKRQLGQVASLLSLALPGPTTLPFRLAATWRTLHASNILSIALVQLPQRRFSTTSARFETSLVPVIATTAADRRIVLADADSGEMLECLEPASPQQTAGHRAAVLCTAQNPALPRELVSTSMDSTLLIWDLLAGGGKPVQTLKDHARFVVRAAFSQDGRFLATAGYDRKVLIYQREPLPTQPPVGDDEDEPEPEPIQEPFRLVKAITTRGGNPESIVFVSTNLLPLPDSDEASPAATTTADVGSNTASRPRTWLAFSCRGECHINYLALPRLDDSNDIELTSQRLASLDVGSNHVDEGRAAASEQAPNEAGAEPADWTLVKCNTNENLDDWHVSYSLLHLALHPSGAFLSAHTGDHARPSSTSTTGYGGLGGGAGASLVPPPKILLVQPLRPGRVHTLFLPAPSHHDADASSSGSFGGGGGSSSLSPAPRHAWVKPRGEALWVAGEDGRVRLLDIRPEEGGAGAFHDGGGGGTADARLRAEVWAHGRPDDADEADVGSPRLALRNANQEASALWTRGGNTVIKDIVVLDDEGTLATCGFDHTVRIVRRRKE